MSKLKDIFSSKQTPKVIERRMENENLHSDGEYDYHGNRVRFDRFGREIVREPEPETARSRREAHEQDQADAVVYRDFLLGDPVRRTLMDAGLTFETTLKERDAATGMRKSAGGLLLPRG